MIATGDELLALFRKKSEESGKLFFMRPDDDKNARGIVGFYQKQYPDGMLEDAVDAYFKKEKEAAVTLGTFVQHMTEINSRIFAERESQRKFQELAEATRKMMEELD